MLNLDVGCGSNKREGFLGVDVNKTDAVDVVADATHLPFKDCCVDYVYSRMCIQHIKDDMKALEEMYRVIKNGGKLHLIIASFYGFLFYKLGLSESSGRYAVFHLYYARKLKTMLEKAGFVNVNVSKAKSVRRIGYDYVALCEKQTRTE
ncbi:MAG: class I SAM-dependent methyltransferase [Candidatus Bathyarchaeales archaeon]